jgi:hypothetical protein
MDISPTETYYSLRCSKTMDSESHGEWWAVGRVEKATKTDIESKQIFHTTEVKSEESSDLPKRSTTYLLVTLTILWVSHLYNLTVII